MKRLFKTQGAIDELYLVENHSKYFVTQPLMFFLHFAFFLMYTYCICSLVKNVTLFFCSKLIYNWNINLLKIDVFMKSEKMCSCSVKRKCSLRMKGSVHEEWKEMFMMNERKCSWRVKRSVHEEWKEVFMKNERKCSWRSVYV